VRDVAVALAEVRGALAAAARDAGRDPSTAQLIAVSKTHPSDRIRLAAAAGQRDFGENYAQELASKQAELSGLDVRWHFIGRIQRNKARWIASAYRVHALEGVAQAEALVARAATGRVAALVAVNVGEEPQKTGVLPSELLRTLDALRGVSGLSVHGLMALPPVVDAVDAVRPYFMRMAALREEAEALGHDMSELSMGMSADAALAVAYGATWVRVGTAIFGAR
jgi:pyridoxal phosphate enzyme (YggS family)